jgi:oligogalacturonide lyase
VRNNMIQVGRKSGHIFFTRTTVTSAAGQQPGGGAVSQDHGSADRTVNWIDPVSGEQHEIGKLPANHNVSTVNCDETLLAGAVLYLDGRGGAPTTPVTAPPGQRINLGARWAQHLPMALLTMDARTGELKTFNPSNDWDNHFQFSPTDPTLLMYCHEGPWQNNDRVWTINVDGTNLFKVHSRTMINEIWGHEFWSPDGATSWYQLNTPRGAGGVAWIAGTNLKTHQETWYHLENSFSSIHVNISPDGKLFAGDGGNGAPWIFLHTPKLARNLAQGVYDASHLIQPGYLETERLVNMSNHQYALEPNVIFTPDNQWIVFRSNMFGPSYVFMVEVAKAAQ